MAGVISQNQSLMGSLLEVMKESHQKLEFKKYKQCHEFSSSLFEFQEIYNNDFLRKSYISAILVILRQAENAFYLDLSDFDEGIMHIKAHAEEITELMESISIINDLKPCILSSMDRMHQTCKEIGKQYIYLIRQSLQNQESHSDQYELNMNLSLASVQLNVMTGGQTRMLEFYDKYIEFDSQEQKTQFITGLGNRIKKFFMNNNFFCQKLAPVLQQSFQSLRRTFQQYYHPLCVVGFQLALLHEPSSSSLIKDIAEKLQRSVYGSSIQFPVCEQELQFLLNILEDQMSYLIISPEPEFDKFRMDLALKLMVNYLQITPEVSEGDLIQFAQKQIASLSADQLAEIVNQIAAKSETGQLSLKPAFKSKVFHSVFNFDKELYQKINAKALQMNTESPKENFHQECLVDDENDTGILLDFLTQLRTKVLSNMQL